MKTKFDRYYRVFDGNKVRFESLSQNEATEYWKKLLEKGIVANIEEVKR